MYAESKRLEEIRTNKTPWRGWGPYLSERPWGTIREDYSESGNAWDYFPHEQAHSRAYRRGEDGLAGLSNDKQRLCIALVLASLFFLTGCFSTGSAAQSTPRAEPGGLNLPAAHYIFLQTAMRLHFALPLPPILNHFNFYAAASDKLPLVSQKLPSVSPLPG